MIGKRESIPSLPRRQALCIEIAGQIVADLDENRSDENSVQDVMIGAVLDRLHGDASDLSWADIVNCLRTDGLTFKIYDED